MKLAIFDLDNTLLGGDSDHAWGEFLVEAGIVDGDFYKQTNDQFYQDYQAGQLDIHAYLEFALQPLAGRAHEELAEWHRQFMASKIDPIILDKGKALLDQHRSDGDYLLIITATNRFVTGPIAEVLGVDDIIATDPEMIDGLYTGKVLGTPSYREGKVERLNHWLADKKMSLSGSSFYSDSHNDLPLLQQVDKPVAVDPDDELKQYALNQDWPIISLRG